MLTRDQAITALILILIVCAISLLLTFLLYRRVRKIKVSNPKVANIAKYIREGAMTFLIREYKAIIPFVLGIAILLFSLGYVPAMKNIPGIGWQAALCFLLGATLSGLSGFIGMITATRANERTTHCAAEEGMPSALNTAFSGGAVLGLTVVSLGLIGVTGIFLIAVLTTDFRTAAQVVTGYGLGTSLIALFSRVGGGIFTKAADVGADLVGKVEACIPEDDPRNPAVIADNVGDNVGDIAGMGSDLAESYVGSLISILALAAYTISTDTITKMDISMLLYPLIVCGIGLIATIFAIFIVRSRKWNVPEVALNFATYSAAAILIVGAFVASFLVLGDYKPFLCVLFGMVAGIFLGIIAEHYTSGKHKPVRYIVEQSRTGHATNIIAGIGVGLRSTFLTMTVVIVAVILAFIFHDNYGIALASIGMLATVGVTISVDGYGPISDNAGGLAQMAGLDSSVREITDHLDAVGNTTAAIGKGFSIGSASLTALALLFAYKTAAGNVDIDVFSYQTAIGILVGAMLPFFFAALTMNSVGKAANHMINEVRRQFAADPGILAGTSEPDYAKCIDISTIAALKEMIIPGAIAVVAPILAAVFLGREGVAGLLIGGIATSTLLGVFMANAGGAWDNAKKLVEEGSIEGCTKGTEVHKATITGDTVGDPFKDTSGPALNILMKLMSIIALIMAPIIANYSSILERIVNLIQGK